MTPELYQQVKELFTAALERPVDDRAAFLDEACAGHDQLRGEVESLLQHHDRPTQILANDPLFSSGPSGEPGRTTSSLLSSDSLYFDPGRFTAGTVVAERYRIVGLLGRGGMGEVYRADDLTLSQPVALKFLPRELANDPKWLARFHNEVRTARQVTHPNVCRVYDIGEFAGEQFITMEYVDGEDLASLLRRIGRLPHDKALQIARQLCAGLAAAHDKGVLHRDLKPANVMIDGRGAVRVTDFGLAAPPDQPGGPAKAGPRAGTPAYMAPELLAGKEVSVRSDIYALGLVLYELFTGKPTFKADSLAEFIKLHERTAPALPSTYVHDVDPIVERTILRCLEKDPARRPASALAVAAALPGGDPLAAALAAGETPSPSMVAAAGGRGAMSVPVALGFLVAIAAGLALIVVLSRWAGFMAQLPQQPKEPAVLVDKAREVIATLGYGDPPHAPVRDHAYAFAVDQDYYNHIEEADQSPDRWSHLAAARPGAIYFWYEQSPDYLLPATSSPGGYVVETPPAPPDTIDVRLDPQGHLLYFEAVPPLTTAPAGSGAAADTSREAAPSAAPWRALFAAADLDPNAFHAVAPRFTPPYYADRRAAWEGTLPASASEPAEPGGTSVRIEAASLQGTPIYFNINVLAPWHETKPRPTLGVYGGANVSMTHVLRAAITILLLIAASFLVWRNMASGRADRNGALRMMVFFLAAGIVAWAARAHHIPDFVGEFSLFTRALGDILYLAVLVWAFYLALEPYVRRVWPETVISWSRLIAGDVLDPLVGRHALIGAAAGIVCMVLFQIEQFLPRLLGLPAPLPVLMGRIERLTLSPVGSILETALVSLYLSLLLLLVLVLLRMVFRMRVIAGIAFVLVIAAITSQWVPQAYVTWVVQAVVAAVYMGLLIRFGLVAMCSCMLFRMLLIGFPMTPDLSVWYARNITLYALAFLLLLAGFLVFTATGGAGRRGTMMGSRPSSVGV